MLRSNIFHNYSRCQHLLQTFGQPSAVKYFVRSHFDACKSLFRKDLFGHFGCVNAIEFSNEGSWLASGGDDRRVLLWNASESLKSSSNRFTVMKCQHMSNIFCIIFDGDTSHLFSSGNDEQVVQHNIETQEAVAFFHHDEAVYSLSQPTDNCNIFASASEDGSIVVWDTRCPGDRFRLYSSTGSFHGVAFNPVDSRLVAAANSHDGVLLFDIRAPDRVMVKYGASQHLKSAMSVKFNYTGRMMYCLYRKSGPVLFSLHQKEPRCKFDHPGYSNVCTMKSACFAGDMDQYVVSGSDNFSVYVWKIPESDSPVKRVNKACLELQGHRSIVNQVRCSRENVVLASAGVEKIVKLWSPHAMHGGIGSIDSNEDFVKREHYTHEEYMRLILQSGQPLTHDYESQSTEEDPRMIAFFDSLIHSLNDSWSTDDSASESSMDGIFQMLINQSSGDSDQEHRGEDGPTENLSTTATLAELRRLFRSNRRMLMREFGIDSSSSSEVEEEEGDDTSVSAQVFSELRRFENSSGLEIIRNYPPRTPRTAAALTEAPDEVQETLSVRHISSDAVSSRDTSPLTPEYLREHELHNNLVRLPSKSADGSFAVSFNRTTLEKGKEKSKATSDVSDSLASTCEANLHGSSALRTVLLAEENDRNSRFLSPEEHGIDNSETQLTFIECSARGEDRKNGSTYQPDVSDLSSLDSEDRSSDMYHLDSAADRGGGTTSGESSSVTFNRSRNFRKRKYRDKRQDTDYS